MLVSDFHFDLPEDLIAQTARPRGASRLLVVDRVSRTWHEATVADLPRLLSPGDCVVVNDTRVFPARLLGRRDPSGGSAECLLLQPVELAPMERENEVCWDALVHPGQKLKPGSRLIFEDVARAPGVRLLAQVLEQRFFGRRRLRLHAEGAASVDAAIDAIGHVPLPPYIRRPDDLGDRDRYQTMFARVRGSVAAPTAGLHFDESVTRALAASGIDLAAITLHVGYGTFKPVRVARVEDHQVDMERFEITPAAAAHIRATRAAGHRVVAVGTTTTRALESAAADGEVHAGAGTTELFISPGYSFRAVDALVTNFHLPQSSLLMLVAAFAGRELVLDTYRHAVANRFRFYSYGDAMLIL